MLCDVKFCMYDLDPNGKVLREYRKTIKGISAVSYDNAREKVLKAYPRAQCIVIYDVI